VRLSIFARLIISYLVLFSMLAGVSLYFIYHLNQFNRITRSIIVSDTELVGYANKLSDALLSETRYERKYVVLKDEQLFQGYQKAQNEFNQLMDQALNSVASQEMINFFHEIFFQHQHFGRLVNEEKERIKTSKPYAADWYEEEKKKVANDIIDRLKTVQQTADKNIFDKIRQLSKAGDKIGGVSMVITVAALLIGLVVAVVIARSISRPLAVIKAKTVEISRGNFKGDLEVSSPPVIAELATAINVMSQKLQVVDNIKSGFFSHMSHELRTPLASIKEGTNMLLDGLGGKASEKQQRILTIIIQECNRMIELVNSLLDLSKMEGGMLTYHFAETSLPGLVRQSVIELGPLAEAKSISIENNIETLPPVQVDQERILQVFRNIIGNAIKFTQENGHIKLDARVMADRVEIAVQDTGIGIPQEDLGRIFIKFQQVIPAKGEKIKGTGLGLATVKQIIMAHGGKVWATSQLGQGSTFYISLPLAAR